MNKRDKRIAIASAVGTTALLSYYALHKVTNKFFNIAFTRKNREVTSEEFDYFEQLSTRKLSLENHQGLTLWGTYINNLKTSEYTLVLLHGYHCSTYTMKNQVETFLKELPCDIFVPDLQGHGESQGKYVGFGYFDAFDMQEWLNFLVEINPGKPIVVLGISMGGATVCHLSAKELPKEVKCLIEDCGYDTLYHQFKNRLFKEYKLPISMISYLLNKKMKKKLGYSLNDARAIDDVAQAKLPMMFIHGLDDDYVDSSMVFNLYNACPTEKELFYVKDAAHAEAFTHDIENYVDTIEEFINRYV